MSVHAGLITVEEYLKLPQPKEGRTELHHGEVVIMPPVKRGHQRRQRRILALLAQVLSEKGVVETETAFRPAPEYEVWQADVGTHAKVFASGIERVDEYRSIRGCFVHKLLKIGLRAPAVVMTVPAPLVICNCPTLTATALPVAEEEPINWNVPPA